MNARHSTASTSAFRPSQDDGREPPPVDTEADRAAEAWALLVLFYDVQVRFERLIKATPESQQTPGMEDPDKHWDEAYEILTNAALNNQLTARRHHFENHRDEAGTDDAEDGK